MPKFLIEVPHSSKPLECAQAVQIWLSTGSHYLSHADWGCPDGNHKSWLTVEVDSREEARSILPPAFRSRASVIMVKQFTLQEANDAVESLHTTQ